MNANKISSINAANLATLQDAGGNVLGTTLDTPNAIAYAMATNKNVVRAVANYQYFGASVTTREQVADRFGWVKNESETHAKFLTWEPGAFESSLI